MARPVNPERYAARRARIVATAAAELAVHGVDGTSTARICRAAGIGSGTLFHYFPSKQELFRAVFADDLPRLRHLSARALAEADPDIGLALVVDHLLAEVAAPLAPGLAWAAALQANRDPELARLLESLDDLVAETLTTLLTRRAATGRAPVLPPEATARWVRALVDSVHLGLVPGPAERVVAELRGLLARLVDGGP